MRIIECDKDTVITTGVSNMFPNGRFRHALGWVEEGSEDRRICHGPMVPGPWAYAYGLCTVLAANPKMGTGYEAKMGREAGTEFPVKSGDILVIDGFLYEVETYRQNEFVRLHRMDLVRSEEDQRSRLHDWQQRTPAYVKTEVQERGLGDTPE